MHGAISKGYMRNVELRYKKAINFPPQTPTYPQTLDEAVNRYGRSCFLSFKWDGIGFEGIGFQGSKHNYDRQYLFNYLVHQEKELTEAA